MIPTSALSRSLEKVRVALREQHDTAQRGLVRPLRRVVDLLGFLPRLGQDDCINPQSPMAFQATSESMKLSAG